MKDMVIGILTGIAAVIATALFTPRPQPLTLPVRELSSIDNQRFNDLGRDFLTMTAADPVYRKLQQTTARLVAKQMPFEKVVNYLADVTGENFYVDWRQLEAAGLDVNSPVSVNLQNVSALVVLKASLDNLGGGNIRVGYCIVDGIVHISTADDLVRYTVTRIYNVRDLIEAEVAWHSKSPNHRLNPDEAEEWLIHLVQETIDPTTWRDNGGTIGGIRGFDGRLIVTQTAENQQTVIELLSGLRRSKGPWPTTQISTHGML